MRRAAGRAQTVRPAGGNSPAVKGRLHRAATTGAFAVATAGDWEGLPTRADLALLDEPSGSTVR